MAREKKSPSAWRDRTVAQAQVDPKNLIVNPLNWRAHPQHQQEAMTGVLDDIGWIQDVIVNQRSGFLIDGHLRVALALKRNEAAVPVKYVDLSEAEELEALATFDPITALATAEQETLKAILEQVHSQEAGVQELLAGLAEQEGIVLAGLDEEPLEDPGPDIDRAEELREQWGVELGQVWELGEHRVVCGDCTDEAVFERMMIDAKILCLSDPPYGISVVGGDGSTHFGKVGGDGIVNSHTYPTIHGDNSIETARAFYNLCQKRGITDYIFWGGNYFSDFLPASRCWLVWDKCNTGDFSPVELAWSSFDHVPKLYSWLWNGLSRKGNRAEELVARIHPTQKPVGLTKLILEDFPSEKVLDGFLGSGTTLIACERLKRKCRGIEITPGYVAVTLQRWAEMTGRIPCLAR